MGAIDLHTHSLVSDGTYSPAELVRRAAAAGLDALALTDHDVIAGWAEAAAASSLVPGLRFIPGLELSVQHGGRGLHILGYGWGLESRELLEYLAWARRRRASRLEVMARRLRRDYPGFSLSVTSQSAGRPHIADALVAQGLARDRYDAFNRFLGRGSPYYVSLPTPDVFWGVETISRAGALAVLAHPGRGAPGILNWRLLGALRDRGLWGLEVDHRDNPVWLRQTLRLWARELGLYVTGSSDFHGRGKLNRLGENTTDPAVFEAMSRAIGLGVDE